MIIIGKIAAYWSAARLISLYLSDWIYKKNDPHIVQEMRPVIF